MNNIHFEYDMLEEHISYFACEDRSLSEKCCKGDYCRCGKIISTTILPIEKSSYQNIKEKIFNHYNIEKNEINDYCIDRIFSIFKMYDSESYYCQLDNPMICPYGQTIEGIYIKEQEKLDTTIEDLLTTPFHLVEFLLLLEYGKILPQLMNLTWEIKEVKFDDIIARSTNHLKKCQENNPYIYNNDMIVCIAKEINSKYILYDGYHRYASALKVKPEKVKIIVGKGS